MALYIRAVVELEVRTNDIDKVKQLWSEKTIFELLDAGAEVGAMTVHNEMGEEIGELD